MAHEQGSREPAAHPARRSLPVRLLQWLVVLIIAPLLLLAVAELGLRAMGYGQSTRYFLERTHEGRAYYVPNKAFYQQFSALPMERLMKWEYLDFQVPAEKAPGACRIFVFGGSAGYGARSFSRVLEAMLNERFPEKTFEIYNTSCPGMNSNVMWAVAKACARLEPDLFLIYMGNNEYIGPFGPTTPLGQRPLFWKPFFIRALIILSDLRLYQLCTGPSQEQWHIPDVNALYEGPQFLADQEGTNAHYRANVQSMCASAQKAGARVVLCTLANNMKYNRLNDPPPLRDMDTALRMPINEEILALAREASPALLSLVDIERALSDKTPDRLPGYDFFCDSVHFVFHGNYLAACAIFDELAPQLAKHLGGVPVPPPSEERCRELLALSPPVERDLLFSQLGGLVDEEPRQVHQQRIAAFEPLIGPDWRNDVVEGYSRALEANGESALLRAEYVQALMAAQRFDEAVAEAKVLVERHPCARISRRALGEALMTAQEPDGAIEAYRESVALFPDDVGTYERLAMLLKSKGAHEEVLAVYRESLKADPMNVYAKCGEAEALEALEQIPEAIAAYREAIAMAPYDTFPYERLDLLLGKHGGPATRTSEWRSLVRAHPDAARAHLHLGLALEAEGQWPQAKEAYQAAADREPHNAEPIVRMGEAAAASGQLDEALRLLDDARQRPTARHGAIALRKGELLEEAGRTQEAIEQYTQSIEQEPNDYRPYERLDGLFNAASDPAECAAQWKAIAERCPGAARAQSFLGRALEAQGDWPGAAKAYRRATELSPADPNHYISLAKALEHHGDTSGAADALRKALQLNPQATHLRPEVAKLLIQSGNHEAAKAELEACRQAGIPIPDELAGILGTQPAP